MTNDEAKEIVEILTRNFYHWDNYCSNNETVSSDPYNGPLDCFYDDFARCTLECYQDGKLTQLETVFGNIERICEQWVNKPTEWIEDLLTAIHFDWWNSGADTIFLEKSLGEKTFQLWNKKKIRRNTENE